MKFKNYYVTWIALFLSYVFILSLILTILNYFHIVYSNGCNIISFLATVIIFSFIGFKFGSKALKKGYLEGIKIGSSLIFLFIIINVLFLRAGFHFEQLVYYVVLLLSSTFGSMVGISKKG